jgi:hypothetical protein
MVALTERTFDLQAAGAAFAWIAEHYMQPLVRPDVLARLRDHQAAGHRVIVVSGTLAAHAQAQGWEILGVISPVESRRF